MLTSRAEYRLLLRHDNADQRLTPYGAKIGLISEERYQKFLAKMAFLKNEKERLNAVKINPTKEANAYLTSIGSAEIKESILASELLKRPEIVYRDIQKLLNENTEISDELRNSLRLKSNTRVISKKLTGTPEKCSNSNQKRYLRTSTTTKSIICRAKPRKSFRGCAP